MNYTYIVQCSDGTLYTGWTNDIDRRVKNHNLGRGAKYTRSRRPVKLVYCQPFLTKTEAARREYWIKQMPRKEKEKLCKLYSENGGIQMKEQTVMTKQGMLEGVREDGCIVFKGVPYAEPPVGELRWKAPKPLKPWQGVLKADHFGNRQAQTDRQDPASFYGKEFYQDTVYATPVSEDGLYLNIWVPEDAREKNAGEDSLLPVAFYIHGGGFLGGCGHEVEFRTNAYARQGVILVTINYRLGIWGFFAHPWLAAEDEAACGNYGIMDQLAALKWVRENISAFGGDPENITIFGQSAGCISTQTLISSPYAKGLFARAILQSGAGYPILLQKDVTLEDAFELGERIVKKAKADSVEALRALPEEILCDIQTKLIVENMSAGKGLPFWPVMNGKFRTGTFDELTRTGQIADVPIMIGSTKDDITVTPDEAKNKNSHLRQSCKDFALETDKNSHKPCYVYYFQRDLPGDEAGAFHSAELWYMFGTLGQCWRPMTFGDFALSDQMVRYWTNFMKNGDPNGAGLEKWRPCRVDDPFEMIFDVEK